MGHGGGRADRERAAHKPGQVIHTAAGGIRPGQGSDQLLACGSHIAVLLYNCPECMLMLHLCPASCTGTLAPQGYPEAVAPQYASYMGWRGVQYFFGGAISV